MGIGFKSYTNSALIKRLGRGIKHITHQMAFTAGEDKHSLLALLNLGSQQRFYIFLLIAANFVGTHRSPRYMVYLRSLDKRRSHQVLFVVLECLLAQYQNKGSPVTISSLKPARK